MIVDASWATRSSMPPLETATAHVWMLDLDTGEAELSSLDTDERTRASRYIDEVDRRRFARRRAIMRSVLGWYANRDPRVIKYFSATGGKPQIVDSEVAFSVSQSGGTALLAVTRGVTIGVDIEQHRELREVDALARSFLGSISQAKLAGMQPLQRSEAFMHMWTIAEACLKADGRGLAGLPFEPAPQGGLEFRSLEASKSHAAAFAAQDGTIERVATFRYVESV